MALLGALVKSAIQFSKNFSTDDSPAEMQSLELERLLRKAADTSFGKYYNFKELLRSSNLVLSYQNALPIFEYDKMHERWWAQQQIEPDITWPGKPDFFALSSGTTGKESKRIPVTGDMLQSIRSVSMSQLVSLANFDLPAEVFEKEILALGSSTDLVQRGTHQEGEISGINASQAPFWFNYFYRPGPRIASIDDWDERVEAIVEEAESWDIGILIGIPPWIQMMLKAIIEHYKLKNIHEIWPSLSLYVSGGVAFENYKNSFEELLDHSIYYQDTYLASEGYFAFNHRPGTQAMKMALQHGVFYEFIPFDNTSFDESGQLLETPRTLTINQVESGKDYALLVSTPAGAWRYMIGDTVRFTDLSRQEILITGRTKYFMNVAGSQLSEEKLNQAIISLSEKLDTPVLEFSLSALPDGEGNYYHQWVIGSEKPMDEDKATKVLDEYLKESNKNYKVARNKALKGIKVRTVPAGRIYDWIEEEKKKGGQVKIPKIMKQEEMKELLNYLNED